MIKDEELNTLNVNQNMETNSINLENQLGSQMDFNPDDYLDKQSFKRMGFGLWLAENRKKITKGITIFLIAISASFFVFSVFNLAVYLKAGDPTKQIIEGNVSTSGVSVSKPLSIFTVASFGGLETDDLIVKVKNENDKFFAKFNYCFTRGGENAFCGDDFIMPGEEKYVMALGIPRSNLEADFEVVKIDWERTDTKKIPNYKEYEDRYLDFPISSLEFTAAASGISDNIDLNRLEFLIKNDSPYSYHQVPLQIIVMKGNEVIGVNKYVLNKFLSGDTRSVKLTWNSDLRGAKDVKIIPVVNILDDDVFLKYQGR